MRPPVFNSETSVITRMTTWLRLMAGPAIGAVILSGGLIGPLSEARAQDTPTTEGSLIKIGVLAHLGNRSAMRQWQPTADYLTQSIADYRFEIRPLSFEEIRTAVDAGEVHFVLTNPALYIELLIQSPVSAVATLLDQDAEGRPQNRFGGVVFTRSDTAGLVDLDDVRGRSVMAVSKNSLGGFQAGWKAFEDAGVSLFSAAQEVRFAGTHDAVVSSVAEGWADVGIVRTGILERMTQAGEIDPADFRVLNRQNYPGFGNRLSTDLYPEWTFARGKQLSDALVKRVTMALFAMPEDHAAAQQGHYAGWTAPLNYFPVYELLTELEVTNLRALGGIEWRDVLANYAYWIWMLVALIMGLVVTTALLLLRNRRLRWFHYRMRADRSQLENQLREQAEALQSTSEELMERNQRVQRAYSQWNDAFDALDDPVFIHDEAFRIVRANKAYLDRAGCTLGEAVGRPYWEVFPVGEGPNHGCREALSEPGTTHMQTLETEDGEVLLCRSFAFPDDSANRNKAIHILRTAEASPCPDMRECSQALEDLTRDDELIHRVDERRHQVGQRTGYAPTRVELLRSAVERYLRDTEQSIPPH